MHWLATDSLDLAIATEWQKRDSSRGLTRFHPVHFRIHRHTERRRAHPRKPASEPGNDSEGVWADEQSIIVGWLPLYHDMGLIGNVLQSMYCGARCVLMSPLSFLQKPARWLEAISRHKATTSGGPNFAYDLCVRKIGAEEREKLDLHSWTVAFNGAEPIRHGTIERFVAAFAPCGFHREAFFPCYGLAEATLFVSGGLKSAPPVVANVKRSALETNEVVACGREMRMLHYLVGSGRSCLARRSELSIQIHCASAGPV